MVGGLGERCISCETRRPKKKKGGGGVLGSLLADSRMWKTEKVQ